MTAPAVRVRAGAGDDSGVTLIEVVVAMTVISIFLAIFTGSILQIYRSVNKTESMSAAQSQLHQAFARLENQVRYASGISEPGTVGGDPYVEFLTTHTGVPTCTQLRLHRSSGQLQQRTWRHGAAPLVPGPWTPLASQVGAAGPFTLVPADPVQNFQRLRLRLAVEAGGADSATRRELDLTFTALNTSLNTSSATTCTEGRATP